MQQYKTPALTVFICFSTGIILGLFKSPVFAVLSFIAVSFLLIYLRIFPYIILIILGFTYVKIDLKELRNSAKLVPYAQKVRVSGQIESEKFIRVNEIETIHDVRKIKTKFFIRNVPDIECGKVAISGVIRRPKGNFRTYLLSNKAIGVLKLLYFKRTPTRKCTPRDYIRKVLKRNSWDSTNFSIMRALVLGERIGLSKGTLELFKKTGTMHILALSGLHVGIITLIIFALFSLFRIEKRIALIATGVTLTLYLFLIGFKSSLLRAYLFFLAIIIAKLSERKVRYLNIWGFAGFLSLVYNPLWILNVGFQFSYVTTLGIILSMIPKVKGIKGYIITSFLTSLAATLFVSPLQIYYFKLFTPVSVLSNLVAIPLVFVILSEVLIGILLSFLHAGVIAQLFFEVANLAIKILLGFLKIILHLGLSYRFEESPINTYQVMVSIAFLVVFTVGIRRVIAEIKKPDEG